MGMLMVSSDTPGMDTAEELPIEKVAGLVLEKVTARTAVPMVQ
jgi:hypothetical protein